MSDNRRRFRSIRRDLKKLYPFEPKGNLARNLNTLAAMISGIVVQNQSVLLKGINDDLSTMRALVTGLLRIRVRPYYLYHCDNAVGVSHFATSLEKGRELMRGLFGYITGFAVPQYVLTTPLGKIPLWEENIHRNDEGYWVENYKGATMSVEDLLISDN